MWFIYKSRSRKLRNASCFKARDLGDYLYGRCFEIEIEKRNVTVDHINIVTRKPVEMYFNLPHTFFSEKLSKIQVNTVGEYLQLEASYEILQTHFDDNCKTYSSTYDQSFDACKLDAFYKNIVTKMNCSVPFMFNPNKKEEICKNVTVSKNASSMYLNHMSNTQPECPVPCVNMITSFGYPNIDLSSLSTLWKNKGRVSIYFKKFVKVTEDFVSYDLLRLYKFFIIFQLCICQNFSMVAEIGGYSGLLIGFSVMDLAVVLKSLMDLLKRMKKLSSPSPSPTKPPRLSKSRKKKSKRAKDIGTTLKSHRQPTSPAPLPMNENKKAWTDSPTV